MASLEETHFPPQSVEEVFLEACSSGNLPLIEVLLDPARPLDPNCTSLPSLKSALFLAAKHNQARVVSRLLKDPRVNVNHEAADSVTPLFIAAQEGAEHVVRLLLLHPRIYVNQHCFRSESTPLWQAAWRGHAHVVRELLRHPMVGINLRDREGSTPLWIAAQEGHLEVVKALFASNRGLELAAVWETNKKTAVEQARQNGHVEVVNLLREYQKDPRGVRDRLRRELHTLGKKT